jgi:hypothetical protein
MEAAELRAPMPAQSKATSFISEAGKSALRKTVGNASHGDMLLYFDEYYGTRSALGARRRFATQR